MKQQACTIRCCKREQIGLSRLLAWAAIAMHICTCWSAWHSSCLSVASKHVILSADNHAPPIGNSSHHAACCPGHVMLYCMVCWCCFTYLTITQQMLVQCRQILQTSTLFRLQPYAQAFCYLGGCSLVTIHLQICSHLCTAIMYAPTNSLWYLGSPDAYSTILNAARAFHVLELSIIP